MTSSAIGPRTSASGHLKRGPATAQDILFRALGSSLVLSCLRTHGEQATADVELDVGRRAHATISSAIPAGNGASGPVARCAEVQQALDEVTRVRPEVVTDAEGRVWLRYRPPHWFGQGLRAPSAALAAVAPSISQAWYRGHHAITAARYGGPTVAFVHTHDMTEGHPLDAGYFVDRGRQLDDVQRYARERGGGPPVLAPADYRRPGVWSAADIGWTAWSSAALRMTVLGELLGPVAAASIIEHAWRIVLGAYWSWLPERFGTDAIVTPVDAAMLYASTIKHTGADVEVEECDGQTLVHHSEIRGATEQLLPGATAAMVRAWSAILPNFEWTLRAVLIQAGSPGGMRTVLFDGCGPEG